MGGWITAQNKQDPIIKTTGMKTATKKIVKPSTKYIISGKVTQTNSYSYRGGIAPSQETIDQIRKENEEGAIPRSFPGELFYIRKGNTNTLQSKILLSFCTDELRPLQNSLFKKVFLFI